MSVLSSLQGCGEAKGRVFAWESRLWLLEPSPFHLWVLSFISLEFNEPECCASSVLGTEAVVPGSSQLGGEERGVNRLLCLPKQRCGPGSVRVPRMEQCPLARERWGWPDSQGMLPGVGDTGGESTGMSLHELHGQRGCWGTEVWRGPVFSGTCASCGCSSVCTGWRVAGAQTRVAGRGPLSKVGV